MTARSETASAHAQLLRMRSASIFTERTPEDRAALAVDRERTTAHHAAVKAAAAATEDYGPPRCAVRRDVERVGHDVTPWSGPTAGLFGGWRTGDHLTYEDRTAATEAAAELSRSTRVTVADEPGRWVWVGGLLSQWHAGYRLADLGPDEFDGGAYAVATHRLADDGTEYKSPHVARLGSVVAQPADPRALRLQSVQWHGRSMAAGDVDTFGAIADTVAAARTAATALVRWAPTGTNGRLFVPGETRRHGQPTHWRPLTLDGARWLHALAGNDPYRSADRTDGQTIVGAIPVAPMTRRARYAVAVDYLHREEDGTTTVRTHVRHDGQDSPVTALAHTARLLRTVEDCRTRSREELTAGRRDARRLAAVETLRIAVASGSGLPVVGDGRSLVVQLARSVVFVSVVCGVHPLEVVDAPV